MDEVTAFSPGHITGFFQICDQTTELLLQGSRGAGISISNGVTTKIRVRSSSQSSFEIRINGTPTKSATVSEYVINSFLARGGKDYEIFVDHAVTVPIGSGLGSSGAGALSLALALNEALNLGLSRMEAAQIAHIAEVKCKTGLGTVIAETFGGAEIRVAPGAPGIGKITPIPLNDDYAVVCLNLGNLSTKKILSDTKFRHRINKSGEKLVDKLIAHPTPANFMTFSRNFAEELGLISPRVRKIFTETDRTSITCSMVMFGETIFSLIKRNETKEIFEVFGRHARSNYSPFITEIDFKGARLVE
ncbi:MAG: GHMP kinase [Candidatus Bathyarchaeota archaeon]|nr:GHMP kinase [Candidatus Bathyarchaeota archaeon]MDH5733707.1 GHMP kinase [Candidatus Bathyarchaeota archaeon]